MEIEIREERPGDVHDVHALNQKAFGQNHEADIVDALRKNGAALLSLVATLDDEVVGHVMYSPINIGGTHEGAALGPMEGRGVLSQSLSGTSISTLDLVSSLQSCWE